MAFRNYILLFALVAGTIAGPINVQDGDLKCATKCEASLSDSAKFQYTPGKTYTYTYQGTTETSLKGSSSQRTNLKIDAQADIEVLSKCEFALKLREVSLEENDRVSPSSNEFKQKLELKPLRFAFQDGVIENVCSESTEDERVLNVKRAVLSTFQNSMKQLDKDGLFTETDISGTCPTNYKSKSALFGGALTISKSKDIIACTDRTGNVTSIHSESYNIPSKLQNAPLLKTSHECEQDISSNMLKKTVCSEVLMFRPFSKDGSGAMTKATQTLTYYTSKTSTSVSQSAVQRRSSLLFHHVYDQSTDVNAKTDVIALLQEICSDVSDSIKKDTPILFGELISKMKRLDSDHMMQVYTAVNNGRICSSTRGKQFFYDAIPLVSTVASLTLSTKLISEKTVQGAEAEMWLTQLAFIPRPTSEMLQVVKPLLDDPTHHSKALLGITAMVHKFCEEHTDCQTDPSVVSIVSILNSNIGSDCMSTTKETRERILITLKAIGNAGDAFTSSSVIGRCITNEDVDTETRVAALQAFRRMPCTVSREDAMRMYQNAEVDSELRIHAFLAVMTCPTSSVLTKVRMMLGGEPVNQVGSFVWTYLENLKETASPLKQELSSILHDAKLRQDFNLDARKFSRNLEKSFFSDYLNAGAQLESNLIWSQRSYIPRSAMLNVTVDMFGDSINLVELGGRVQGLEKIVEKFFGPNGYFSKKNVNELMDNKRQAANYISTFDKSFQTPDDKITTSMYVKLFGNEIGFMGLDSDEWTDIKNFNVLDFLIKLAEPKKIDITKNLQIMDSSLIVPTCIGFPMNLTVNGTASISVDVDGNVDLRKIAASPRSFDINGHIKPSAAIVVSGLMGVDAIVTKSSMKMVSTMHSNTQLDGKITLQDGEIFNMQLNTPQEKVEVFHVQTEFFMNGQEMTMPEPAKVYKKCTPAMITKVSGMEMCVDVELPTFHQDGLPLPPFTGPMNAQVFIEKKDTHTGYAFVAKYEKDQSEMAGVTYTKRVVHMSLDTPGSAVDRKLLMEAIYDPANMAVSAEVLSPWKKFQWSSSIKNEMEMKEANTQLVVDGQQTYSMAAKMGVKDLSTKTVWSPSLTITIPNKPQMSVTGTFETGTGETMAAVDLSIKNFSRKPISLTSSLTQVKNGASYDLALNLKSELLTSEIKSSVALAPGSYSGQAYIMYIISGRPTHRFTLAGKFSDDSIGELMSYSMQAGFIPTEFPDYQFNIDTSLEVTANHVDTKLDLQFSKEKLFLAHKTIKQGTWQALSVTSSSSFKYPTKNIDISTEVTHEHNSDLIKTSATCTWAGETYKSTVNLDKTVADKYTGEATLSYPGRNLATEMSVSKMVDGEHKIMMKTQWADDVNSQVSLTSTWKSGTTHEITGDVKVPGHPVTFSVSFKPNVLDYMSQVNVVYNLNSYTLKSEYKLETNKITSSGSWVSPNRAYSYDINMSSINGKMAATSEVSWAPTKKVSMTAEYNNRDTSSMFSRDGTFTFTTPYGDHTFNSEIEMSSNNFARMSTEVTLHGVRSVMSGRYSMGTGEFSLDTPYIRYGEIKSIAVTFNHDDSHAESTITWAPSKKVTGEVKWSDTKYSIDVTTPLAISRLGASVELPTVGSPSAKVYWNSKEASLTVSYPNMNKGEFTLTYPDHTVTGSFSGQVGSKMFNGESELSYDDKKLWGRVVFSATGPVTLTVDVTTPFDVKKISANMKHEGTMTSFKSESSVSWDSQRVRTTMEFSGKEAKLSVKSPWTDDMLAQYLFNGDMTSFKTNGLIQWANDKKMTADVSFDMTKDVTTSFSTSSPFYDTITGSFEHTGEIMNCDNKLTLTWSPSSTFSATSKISTVNGLSLQVDVTSPKKVSLTFTHTGDVSAWSNKVELTIASKAPISVYSDFSMAEMDAKVGFKGLELEQVQSAEWSVQSTKYANKIDVMSTMSMNDKKSVEASLMLSKVSGYGMSASLTLPTANTYTMSVTHTHESNTISNVAMVQWAPNMKMTAEMDISTASGLEVKATINSPWRQMTYTLNKIGSSDEFHASSIFSWETGKQISSSLQFSRIGDMTVEWSLKTPFDAVKDVNAKMTHRGTAVTNFQNQLEGDYNGQKVQLATKVDMKKNSCDFTFLTVNPWKSFNTNMKYSGMPTDFTASADFTMGSNTYSANTKFANTNGIELTVGITPVIYKPITFSAILGRPSNTASLRWGDNKVISATASLRFEESLDTMDALVKFETPFEGYESGEATIKHSGTMKSFRETVEVAFNTQKARLTGGFSTTGKISGDITLTSPWYNCDGSFQHSGDMKTFDNSMEFTYATGKTVQASSKWTMVDKVSAEMTFNAPFKTFDATYTHEFSLSGELSGMFEVNVDNTRMLHTDMKYLNNPSNINVEFSLQSPWKSFSGKYSHVGNMQTRCNSEAEFTWESQTVSAEWSVSMATGFSTEVTIQSPWKNFSGEIDHVISTGHFENTISATYATGKTVKLVTEFDMTPDILFKSTFTSPFKNANVMYRHSGSWKNFACHLTGLYGDVPVTANLNWSSVTGYETSFDMTSPWKNVRASFKTNTDLANLSSSAELEWGTEKIESTMTFNSARGYQGTMSVKTPWRIMSTNFSWYRNVMDLDSTASVSWESGKEITVVISNKSRTGKIELVTPWRTMSANYMCSGSWENYTGMIDFSWESGKKITLNGRADSRTGLDSEWKLTTPWRDLSTSAKFDQQYNTNVMVSWETDKAVNFDIKNSKTGNLMKSGVTINTPWRDMSASYSFDGTKTKFDATTEFSWVAGQNMKMETSWNMETGMSGSTIITTPWRIMSANFNHEGNLTKFNGNQEISWETGKKIATSVAFNRENGWESRLAVTTPWRDVETNMNFNGNLTAFTSGFDFSWETGKKMTTSTSFTASPLAASWTYKCLNKEMNADLKHEGTLTDFTNSASFSWEPTKKVEISSTFKMADNIEGRAFVKTPFASDVELTFEHTSTSGEMSFVNPWSNLKAEYTYKDMYNFEGKFTHGTTNYEYEMETTWINGLQTTVKCVTPQRTYSVEIDHQGNFSTFKNTLIAKYGTDMYKLISNADVPKRTFSQILTTPIQGYETQQWLTSFTSTDSTVAVRATASQNTKNFEFDITAEVDEQSDKTVIHTMLEVITPFTGYENNKMTELIEYSSQLVHYKATGHLGTPTNSKNFEIYSMLTTQPSFSLQSYMKTNLAGDKESEVTFNSALKDAHLTATYNADVEFYPAINGQMTLDVKDTRDATSGNHVGSLDLTGSQEHRKFSWTSGSNSNMCETSFSYALNSLEQVTYTQKSNWTSGYMKLNHETTLKVPSVDALKDCDFKFSWDLTQPKKKVNLAMFNDPKSPFDFKAEYEKMNVMVELATPFEAVKTQKTTVTINKAQQPWTLKVENELNQKTMKFEGRLSCTSWRVFDFTSSFTSQIAKYENLMMSVSSSSTQGQWKPHATVQWADDKKIDLTATIGLTSPYKATLEFSSPFENWRSLSMDAAFDVNLPKKLTASFELTPNTPSKKISSQLNFDMDTQQFLFTLNTPWQSVSSFEMSSNMKPRINAFVKLNGKTLFSVSGNAQITSLISHDIDITMTYPFLNEYMRVKINNDWDMSGDNSMHSYMDMEYMRGTEINFKFDFKSGVQGTFSLSLETPFEMLEKTTYTVTYDGSPQSWTENTEAEFYYGKVTTRTSFSMVDGLAYHQTVTGQMKNGVEDFTFQKDLVFTGDSNKFDLQSNMSGSMVPTMKFETSWQYNPVTLSLKTTFNKYSIDYTHTGPVNDFTCKWTFVAPESNGGWFSSDETQEWVGTFSFKYADELTVSADMTCPHGTRFELTSNANAMKGHLDSSWTFKGDKTVKVSTSYERVADPFRYKGSMVVEANEHKLSTSVDLTENSINFPIAYDDEEIFAIRASNPLNADKEYVPTINMVISGAKYEFDGLFKNEGEGLVRDFKLHMNGPRGDAAHKLNFQLEFRTQSSQMVPGDLKLYISSTQTSTGRENKMLDMTADWGNDRALITFRQPQPMRYSIDFSVSTAGQTGTIEANWDTDSMDRNMKMDFSNKFSSTSRKIVSEVEVDMIYGGISRGFSSTMDWQEDSYAHKLTFDYNGKEVGYDMTLSKDNGLSVEMITQWRNVKFTWNVQTPSDTVTEATLAIYWDSARDMSKRFLGSSKWERTDVNTYKWTTTVAHPALASNLVITDNLSYNTSNVIAALNKKISYSSDKTKDVVVDIIMQKNGKWGVELKQDFNKVDVKIGSEFTQTGSSSTVMYKAANGVMKTIAFSTFFDSSRKTAFAQLVTPIKTIKLESMTSADSYTVALTVDGKKYTSTFTVQPDNMYMLIKMSGQKTDVELEAKRLTSGYQVQLVKIEGSKTTIEGLASISMNESNTINGKLYWNPTLVSEIQTKMAALRTALKDTVKTMYTAGSSELSNKKASMQLGNDFDRIMPHHESELALLKSDIAAAKTAMQKAYSQDIFFMKSIDEATSGYITWMGEMFDTMGEKMMDFYERVMQPCVQRMKTYWNAKLEQCKKRRETLVRNMQQMADNVIADWNEYTEEMREDLESVRQWLQVYIDQVAEFISEHPAVQTLTALHTAIMDRFTAIVDAIYSRVVIIADPQMYADTVYNVHSYMADSVSSSLLTGVSDSMMYKLKYYYDYYQVSDNLKIFFTHAKNVAKEYMNDYLTHYIDHTIEGFKWVSYDLSTGRIEFEFVIPTTLDKINMLAIKSNLKQTMTDIITHIRQHHFNVRDVFYMYKPTSFSKILPPFDAQAIIAGQHIRTFDKRHYDFSSNKCSYLLARDFQDGNFTIYVNYEGAEQTITVHSNGKTVDIQQDNTVKLDGAKVELPYQFFNTTITRMGAKVVMSSTLGMKVICDNMNGLCTVDMSGHYFAKTGGLFGTYNYEPLDDFRTSTNTNTSDVLEFANSWTSGCNGKNTAKSFSHTVNTKEYTACAALFKEANSPLSGCFSVVDPQQAFHKCINDMSTDVTLTATDGPCKAVALYKTECEFAGLSIEQPAQCVSCKVGSNTIQLGETSQITQPIMAADVVFIVEEKMCNYEIDTKLPTLAKLIESSLSANSYTNVRFGLIGFGGEHVHSPSHTHTMDSKMLAARSELSLGTSALEFSSAGSNKDVFDAIDFATGYPFRAGANKVIIVLPCSDCSETQHSYRSIAEKLASQEIAVHVMNDFAYEVSTGKYPGSTYLFGIDNYTVYTMKDISNVRGTKRLYPIINKPTDACSSLALQTDGTVFDVNMMTKQTSATIKNFQTVFANRLAQTTTPSRCTSCSCEWNPMFAMSRSVCKKC